MRARVKVLIVFLSFVFVSCSLGNSPEIESSGLMTSDNNSVETVPSTIDTESTCTQINNYEVNALLESFSFDELLDWYCVNMGIDDISADDTIIYYSDYSDFLSNAVLEEDSSGDLIYSPQEYEYHITRSFVIDSIACVVYEFDSDPWCEEAFLTELNASFTSNNDETVVNHASEGYFFFYNDNLNYCKLVYWVGDCLVSFRFFLNNTTTNNEVLLYCEMCSEYGIPTCDRVTETISG